MCAGGGVDCGWRGVAQLMASLCQGVAWTMVVGGGADGRGRGDRSLTYWTRTPCTNPRSRH